MTYLKAKWINAPPDEPVLMYSELDENRWEVRKVEIYCDGTAGLGRSARQAPLSAGLEPVPSLSEINAQAEFEAIEIDGKEFEQARDSARHSK